MTKRDKVYLDTISRETAWDKLLAAWQEEGGPQVLETETIPTYQAMDRVLAEGVFAPRSVPHYRASAMDGIAVKSADTQGAGLASPVILKENQTFSWLDTGDPIPPGYDAVIMVEDVHILSPQDIEITSAAVPGQHIRPIGEDIKEGRLLLPPGRKLSPHDISAAVSCGVLELTVYRKPRVAVIPTGDELVPPETRQLQPGKIVESNSALLKGLLESRGAQVEVFPITKDEPELLQETVSTALARADLVLVNAGSSAGRDDYTARVIGQLGRVLVHGLAIRPGAPVILGVAQGKPVVGIPGYPVSAALVCEIIAWPIIDILTRTDAPDRQILRATLTRRLASPAGREEYLRMNVAKIGGSWVAIPGSRGSGNLRSLAESDGWVVVPEGSQGLEAGMQVEVLIRRPIKTLERTLVLTGDSPHMDRIVCDLAPKTRVVAVNADPRSALLAVKRGEAHGAMVGKESHDQIPKYLRDLDIQVVELEDEILIFSQDNKELGAIQDLCRYLGGEIDG